MRRQKHEIFGTLFFADENIHSEIVIFLKSLALQVNSVWDHDLIGASDHDILHFAHRNGDVILTQDRDFGSLIYASKIPFTGIIYLRPGHLKGEFHIQTLKSLIDADLTLILLLFLLQKNKN